MPLESILKKIQDSAAATCEEILSNAEDERTRKINEATQNARQLENQIVEAAKREALPIKSIALSRADSLKRQMILSAKRDLVTAVFNEALKRLSSMDSHEYREMLLEMISKASKGDERIVLGFDDKTRLGEDFGDVVKKHLKSLGKKDQVTVVFSNDFSGGGFMLQKGGVSWNFTFPAVLSVLRDELEMEVARILFEGSTGAGD